ncbi:MAG: acyl carrier protein [Gemmatimonadetes bacterium]|nr:acyl carrier protein [Gemmatimonadota bacterium]
MEARIRQVMADILGIDPGAINAGTSMETVPAWDSAAHISLVAALEEEFGTSLDVGEIERMLSYRAIVEVLHGRG